MGPLGALEDAVVARTFDTMRLAQRAAGCANGGNMAIPRGDTPIPSHLLQAMGDADYVLIDGVVFESAYLGAFDDVRADDIVLEARHGDTEVGFTRAEMDGAEHLGEGVYRLQSGALLRFLSSATVH